MSCHYLSFLVSVSGVLDCQFHPTQPWIFTAGADHMIRLYTWQYSFSSISFWLQSTSGRGQRRNLTRINPAVMIIEPISARYNTGAAFDFRRTKNFSSLRFSLEELQTNMAYPYGYRFTCYLRRTWLNNNIFKPRHEDLPKTKVVLPNMWQVVNKKHLA